MTQLSLSRLREQYPAAATLAEVCALLAPEPIPAAWFPAAAAGLSGPLAAAVSDAMAWRRAVGWLGGSSLARIDQEGLVMHRLTQAIIGGQLDDVQATATRAFAAAVLAQLTRAIPRTRRPGRAGQPCCRTCFHSTRPRALPTAFATWPETRHNFDSLRRRQRCSRPGGRPAQRVALPVRSR